MPTKDNSTGLKMGAVLAYILLSLYTCSIIHFIKEVLVAAQNGVETITFPQGMVYVVTTVGGLVSALVVARLTITPPKESVGEYEHTEMTSGMRSTARYLTFAYLLIWLATGLAALIIGVMLYPDINSTLRDLGTSWFGLAVTSVYTYFGLEPAPNQQANATTNPPPLVGAGRGNDHS